MCTMMFEVLQPRRSVCCAADICIPISLACRPHTQLDNEASAHLVKGMFLSKLPIYTLADGAIRSRLLDEPDLILPLMMRMPKI